jgi:hypothetical protein
MENQNSERRLFLKTLAGIGITVFAGSILKTSQAIAETCDKAVPKNPMVSMLGYVPKSTTKNQSCANCIQFQGTAKDKTGKCPIFQGCEVASGAWCKSWSKKA